MISTAPSSSRQGRVEVSDWLLARLSAYLELLTHWNRTINLTSLSLEPPSDQAIDRLLIEPLLAGPLMDSNVQTSFDLGSGGGSPAIPLKLAFPIQRLVMVESRERKAAFLREAARVLQLDGVEVRSMRIEAVGDARDVGQADLVTVRAVRLSATLFSHLNLLLRPGGQALLFGMAPQKLELPRGLQVQHVEPPLLTLRRSR